MGIGHLGVLAASLAREEFNHSSASIRVWQVPMYEHVHVELKGTSQPGMCDVSFSLWSSYCPEVKQNTIEVVVECRSQRFIWWRYDKTFADMFYNDCHLTVCAKVCRRLGMQLFLLVLLTMVAS